MNKTKPIFLSGLNGIRAMAAIGVLFSHINLSLKKFDINSIGLFGAKENGGQSFWQLGAYGVTMFFALSGFLITFLLLKELEKTNKIDLKKFYVRRILRIWPLYFMYVFLVVLTLLIFEGSIDFSTLSYYLFFLANIPFALGEGMKHITHFWSISVEEQFYLFWPLIFMFIGKRRKALILFLICFQFCLRLLLIKLGASSFYINLSTINRFDCMMIGGCFAILYFESNVLLKLVNSHLAQMVAWLIILVAMMNKVNFLHFAIENFIFSIVTSVIIIGQVYQKNRIINLENSPLSYLGKLSYGIYVYHPLIIYFVLQTQLIQMIENEYVAVILVFCIITVLTILTAHLSYYLIEKRFLNLKHRFSIVKSTNSRSDI